MVTHHGRSSSRNPMAFADGTPDARSRAPAGHGGLAVETWSPYARSSPPHLRVALCAPVRRMRHEADHAMVARREPPPRRRAAHGELGLFVQESAHTLHHLVLRIERVQRAGAGERVAGEEALVEHLAAPERAAHD